MQCHRTRRGWRLVQHGTVLSEALATPGPTHSVFDVLAAACLLGNEPRDVAILGFGGGSVVAALRALGSRARVHAVDSDPMGLALLRSAGGEWLEPFSWSEGDALEWLSRGLRFDVILDDLSIAVEGDVVKPASSWQWLPARVARHLRPGGVGVFNLLRPAGLGWKGGVAAVTGPFPRALGITLRDFENRIILAGATLEDAPAIGRRLRALLVSLGSHQADRIRVSSIAPVSSQGGRSRGGAFSGNGE